MELVNGNNIYINLGDNQYRLIRNEYIYEFKKYYFNKEIEIKYGSNIFNINLKEEQYFQIKTINIGSFILLFVFNKKNLFLKEIIKIIKINKDDYYINHNNIEYNKNKFLIFKLNRLIKILKNKLGTDIKLPKDIIFNIIDKLNIIEKTIDELDVQKILYYIEYIKNTFSL